MAFEAGLVELFFFTRPCTYATVHSIDGAASNFFYLHFSGSARSRNFIVSGSVLPPYARANIFHLNKGDLRNQTRAASSASERFIHYTIAARANVLFSCRMEVPCFTCQECHKNELLVMSSQHFPASASAGCTASS